ncbi:leucine zipper domain-containing protein [Nocardia vinacea]
MVRRSLHDHCGRCRSGRPSSRRVPGRAGARRCTLTHRCRRKVGDASPRSLTSPPRWVSLGSACKWVNRFRRYGKLGLLDRSSAPATTPRSFCGSSSCGENANGRREGSPYRVPATPAASPAAH